MRPLHLLWLALALSLPACAQSHRGTLNPVRAAGVELVSTHGLPDDTVRLSEGGITADVTGRWSDQGESIEIRYRAGPTPTRLPIVSASTWHGHSAPANAAWDRSAPEPGNAIGRPLLDAGTLDVAPGKPKLVQIEYGRTTPDGEGPTIGDEVIITVPMPGGARETRFRVSGE